MPINEYNRLHKWVRENLGKADKCENPLCVYPKKRRTAKILIETKTYDWANISGEYKKEISDFKSLCRSCHMKMDYTEEKRKKVMGNTNHARKVKQYDLNGKFIREWKMVKDAVKELGIAQSSISNALSGNCKKAGNYIWR